MSTTEDKAKSQDKKILEGLSMARVYDFLLQEDEDEGAIRAEVLLREQYRDAKNPESKSSHLSRQYLLDRGFGKAPRSVDVTSKGEKITAGIFIESLEEEDDKEV